MNEFEEIFAGLIWSWKGAIDYQLDANHVNGNQVHLKMVRRKKEEKRCILLGRGEVMDFDDGELIMMCG